MPSCDGCLSPFPRPLSSYEPRERRQPKVADDYAKWFRERFQWPEKHLDDGRGWLVAGRFTSADIAVGYACLLAGHLALLTELEPATRGWWERCQQRKGYQRARLEREKNE